MSETYVPNEAFLPEGWEDMTPEEQIEGITGPDAEKAKAQLEEPAEGLTE